MRPNEAFKKHPISVDSLQVEALYQNDAEEQEYRYEVKTTESIAAGL
jgi:hypothetical protein